MSTKSLEIASRALNLGPIGQARDMPVPNGEIQIRAEAANLFDDYSERRVWIDRRPPGGLATMTQDTVSLREDGQGHITGLLCYLDKSRQNNGWGNVALRDPIAFLKEALKGEKTGRDLLDEMGPDVAVPATTLKEFCDQLMIETPFVRQSFDLGDGASTHKEAASGGRMQVNDAGSFVEDKIMRFWIDREDGKACLSIHEGPDGLSASVTRDGRDFFVAEPAILVKAAVTKKEPLSVLMADIDIAPVRNARREVEWRPANELA